MDPGERDEWREADRLFASLIELDSNERQRRIAQLDSNAAVRTKLAILFESTSRGNRLLDAKSVMSLPERLDPPTPGAVDALIGRRFGEWQLVGLLGRGGMAAVYRAQRVGGDYEQHAAVKLLSVVLRGAGDHARFKRERRILAHLQHPHIASLFDGGIAEDGTPYLAMSLIEGERIDEYGERHGLDVAERVRLILQVCAAVAYANRQLVVHRDIKPGNILVDAEGRATLLDFGIARLLDADSTDEATVTRAFTPDYAAPEQRVGGRNLGTAVDVYGLAAVLHRLLTGEPPRFDTHGDALPASQVAREAGHESAARVLRGDLDAILAHALATDPQQRYAGADALAADLAAWLEHRPVRARRPGLWGRARKLVRRNPLASGLAALCLVIALIATAAVVVGQIRLREHAAELQTVVDFQSDMLKGIDSQAVGVKLRHSFAVALEDNPSLDTETRKAALSGVDFTGLAVGMLDEAVLARSRRAVHERFDGQPRMQATLLQTLATTYRYLLRLEDARPLQDEATALFIATLGEDDPATLASLREQARLATRARGDDDEALIRRVLMLHERHLGADAVETAQVSALLGEWLLDEEPREAEALLRPALARIETAHGRAAPETIEVRSTLAVALASQDRYAEAESLFRAITADARATFGRDHPMTLEQMNYLAWTLGRLDRDEEAHALYSDVYELSRAALGELDPRTLNVLNNLAAWPRRRGDYASAEPMQRKAWEGTLEMVGPDHPVTLRMQANLAEVCLHVGKLDEADELLTGALREWTRRDRRRPIARLQRLLGQTSHARGHRTDAERAFEASWNAAIASDLPDEQRETAAAFVDLYADSPADAAKRAEWQSHLDALAEPATAP